ncbi:aminotransferase class I/II-fold pyridoxal phosphate-dependent enzyme [bacterium]|nr:aminotransferase class I/II-fold pyridoxal phosphate-dependent enzyme [bacterium]
MSIQRGESEAAEIFSAAEAPEKDAIFALTARYQEAVEKHSRGELKTRPITLGIGKYTNGDGKTPVLKSVATALQQQLEGRLHDSPTGGYQSFLGGEPYRRSLEELVLGGELAEQVRGKGVLASSQTLGGTGANFIQGAFLQKLGVSTIALSNPTWGNHKQIFPFAGLQITAYPYFDRDSSTLTYEEMLQAIRLLPKGSAVSFHACCHNPSGADPSNDQWRELAGEVKARELIAVFDTAYAGFGDGFDEDLFGVRHFVQEEIPTLVAFSFSKIASLYEERVGACLVALPEGYSRQEVIDGLLGSLARPTYSNPPALVARAVAQMLADSDLRKQWFSELGAMSAEIKRGGCLLQKELEERSLPHGKLTQRKGMFTLLPLSPDQVKRLEEEHALYLLSNGRINLAAVKEGNVVEIANRIAAVF